MKTKKKGVAGNDWATMKRLQAVVNNLNSDYQHRVRNSVIHDIQQVKRVDKAVLSGRIAEVVDLKVQQG